MQYDLKDDEWAVIDPIQHILPCSHPPFSTVRKHFHRWSGNRARQLAGHSLEPAAVIITAVV